jgi:PAS domain S-box-containing protein
MELAKDDAGSPDTAGGAGGDDFIIDSDRLAEILAGSQFTELMKSFWETVGVPAAIIDLQARVLASSPWQPACTDFHRVNDVTCARCIESDTELAFKLNEGQPFAMYRCKNGLTDCASPVIIGGKAVANAFVGQFLTAPPDMEFFRRQAEECGIEVEPYLASIAALPIVSEEKLPAILSFLLSMANTVVSMTMERLRAQRAEEFMVRRAEESQRERAAALSLAEDADQARAEIEQYKGRLEMLVEERTEELKASEERSRLLLHSAGEGIFGVDGQGRLTFVNPAALKMLGFAEEEVMGRSAHELFHHSRIGGAPYPVKECPMHASFTDGTTHQVDDEVLWRKDGGAFPEIGRAHV